MKLLLQFVERRPVEGLPAHRLNQLRSFRGVAVRAGARLADQFDTLGFFLVNERIMVAAIFVVFLAKTIPGKQSEQARVFLQLVKR